MFLSLIKFYIYTPKLIGLSGSTHFFFKSWVWILWIEKINYEKSFISLWFNPTRIRLVRAQWVFGYWWLTKNIILKNVGMIFIYLLQGSSIKIHKCMIFENNYTFL